MWRDDRNDVNKVFKEKARKATIYDSSQYSMTYPQVSHEQKNKIWLGVDLRRAVHIFTPLIVVINLYI